MRRTHEQRLDALRLAFERRAAEEQKVIELVATCREAGVSWQMIGDALGTTRQAAQQRFGKGETIQGTMLTDAQRKQVVTLYAKARDVEWLNAHFFSVDDNGQVIKRAARRGA